MKPVFIAVDGIDGTGKTTQIEFLLGRFKKAGFPVEHTKEPGGTKAGAQIRSILLNRDMSMDSATELLLFCADRAEHQKKIKNLLADGISVISDRFLPSTYAYQIFGRKLSPDLLEKIIPQTVHIFPDLTLILDMDITASLERACARLEKSGKTREEGRFEAENIAFFEDVRKGFLWYAEQTKFGKSEIIDASGSIYQVADQIEMALVNNGLIK